MKERLGNKNWQLCSMGLCACCAHRGPRNATPATTLSNFALDPVIHSGGRVFMIALGHTFTFYRQHRMSHRSNRDHRKRGGHRGQCIETATMQTTKSLLAFTNFAHSILSFNLVKRRELSQWIRVVHEQCNLILLRKRCASQATLLQKANNVTKLKEKK